MHSPRFTLSPRGVGFWHVLLPTVQPIYWLVSNIMQDSPVPLTHTHTHTCTYTQTPVLSCFFAAEYGHATPNWRNEARKFKGGSSGLHLWTVRPPRLWNHFLQVGHCTAPCCSDTVFRLSDRQTFSTAVPLSPHCC